MQTHIGRFDLNWKGSEWNEQEDSASDAGDSGAGGRTGGSDGTQRTASSGRVAGGRGWLVGGDEWDAGFQVGGGGVPRRRFGRPRWSPPLPAFRQDGNGPTAVTALSRRWRVSEVMALPA